MKSIQQKELNIRLTPEDIVKLNEVISYYNTFKPQVLNHFQEGGGIARKVISALIDAELNRLIGENRLYKNLESELRKVKKESIKRRIKISELEAKLEASQTINK